MGISWLVSCLFIIVSFTFEGQGFDLLILHTNDMHARFEKTTKDSEFSPDCVQKFCYGGFARLAHVVRSARKKAHSKREPNVIFLNAGDTFTGTIWFSIFKSKIALDFMNMLQPDVSCLGNHEFDVNMEELAEYVNMLNSPVVCANINASQEPSLQNSNLKTSIVLNVSGHSIGIIGYITPATRYLARSTGLTFSDEIESIRNESLRLHTQRVRILIALGHSGYVKDKQIAAEVPLIDVVVGGHSHTYLASELNGSLEIPEGPYPTIITQPSGKQVPVVQAYAYTKYVGQLYLSFNDTGHITDLFGKPLLLDDCVIEENDIIDNIKKYKPEIDKLNSLIVGKTNVFLEGGHKCRVEECNLGNLLTDAMIEENKWHYRGKYWTDIPIALINGGGIRSSINASAHDGNISESVLMSVLPFNSSLFALSIMGEDLTRVLEISVSNYQTKNSGAFLQFSGITVIYNLTKPIGERVSSVRLRCSRCFVPVYENLKMKETYRILIYDYLLNGGDGYAIFKERGANITRKSIRDIDIMHAYLQKCSPVSPEISGRINFVTQNKTSVQEHETLVQLNDKKSGSIWTKFFKYLNYINFLAL